MDSKHEIVDKVYAAKNSSLAADDLVRQYLPFIKAETVKQIRRPLDEDADDDAPPAQSTTLSKDDIKAIALDHAVLKETDIRGLEIELDDGLFQVEFTHKATEYTYIIHPVSGQIVNTHQEIDD